MKLDLDLARPLVASMSQTETHQIRIKLYQIQGCDALMTWEAVELKSIDTKQKLKPLLINLPWNMCNKRFDQCFVI